MKFTKRLSLILTLVLTMISGTRATAAVSPISVGLMPPAQFPAGDFSVTGLRASMLYGQHRDMYGIDT